MLKNKVKVNRFAQSCSIDFQNTLQKQLSQKQPKQSYSVSAFNQQTIQDTNKLQQRQWCIIKQKLYTILITMQQEHQKICNNYEHKINKQQKQIQVKDYRIDQLQIQVDRLMKQNKNIQGQQKQGRSYRQFIVNKQNIIGNGCDGRNRVSRKLGSSASLHKFIYQPQQMSFRQNKLENIKQHFKNTINLPDIRTQTVYNNNDIIQNSNKQQINSKKIDINRYYQYCQKQFNKYKEESVITSLKTMCPGNTTSSSFHRQNSNTQFTIFGRSSITPTILSQRSKLT